MKSLTKAELDALLAVAEKKDPLVALMLLVAFNHGLRVSEVINLTPANIVDGCLVIQRLKGSNKTVQPLLPNEKARLEALAQCGLEGGRFFPMSRFAADRRIKRFGKQAEVPAHKRTMHKLKHTTGRLGYEGGMGIPELGKYLGHKNLKNTLVYMEASEESACNAFAAAVGK